MPKRVTYGVTGLIDWNAVIKVGKARLSVHFTGGALTKYGVTPAEYTTTDPTTQRIIEDSAYFRSGKIKILRSVGKTEVKPLSRKNPLEAKRAFEEATLPIDQPAPDTPGLRTIKVDCMDDATDYMRQHYGIPAVSICTRESLQQRAAQYGLTFEGL